MPDSGARHAYGHELSAPITIHGVSSAAAAIGAASSRARHEGQRHTAANDTRGDDELAACHRGRAFHVAFGASDAAR